MKQHIPPGASMGVSHTNVRKPIPMTMDLGIKCTCRVGNLFIPGLDIETCTQYSMALFLICTLCFTRHLITRIRTRTILGLPGGEQSSAPEQSDALQDEIANYGSTTKMETKEAETAPSFFARLLPWALSSHRTEQEDPAMTPMVQKQQGIPASTPYCKLGEKLPLKKRLLLTAYYTVSSGTSLLVMLLAMSFNLGILLAILIGEAVGHLVFATDSIQSLVESGGLH